MMKGRGFSKGENSSIIRCWKRIPLTICLFLLFKSLTAQFQYSNWYFGNRLGLDFRTSPPTLLYNGGLRFSDASASISDSEGNLLFYTNGSGLFNCSNQLMPWSESCTSICHLLGSFSHQGTIIVPSPNDYKRFYVFCNSNMNGAASIGSTYTLVDIQLNEGKGGTVEDMENIVITTDTDQPIMAVRHANLRDFWIIIRNFAGDKFYSYLLSPTGLSEGRIESTIPNGQHSVPYPGQIKVSQDGKYLASKSNDDTVQLYSFDNSTGEITLIDSHVFEKIADYVVVGVGLEFSPDGRKLYALVYDNADGNQYVTRIYQFDLNSEQFTPVEVARQESNDEAYWWMQMQLAIDGKIYLSVIGGVDYEGYRHLSAIEKPNEIGNACSFNKRAVEFASSYTMAGLPNFPVYPPINMDIEAEGQCAAAITTFTGSYPAGETSLFWHFGDGQTSTEPKPTHTYTTAGNYTVTLSVTYTDNTTESTQKTITIYDKPNTSAIKYEP